MKGQRQHFGAAHLVAFVCVVAALVSALVSAYPQLALAKVLSLCLLFVYTSSGARLAILGREAHFVKGLLLGCEIIVYVSAFAYLLFHLEIWGNPNSLGAMMGVVAEPFLLWGTLVSDTPGLRYRRAFALLLCAYLLYFSLSRAGMVAGAIATVVLCLSLRKQDFLAQERHRGRKQFPLSTSILGLVADLARRRGIGRIGKQEASHRPLPQRVSMEAAT
jgi:hypothetical protein